MARSVPYCKAEDMEAGLEKVRGGQLLSGGRAPRRERGKRRQRKGEKKTHGQSCSGPALTASYPLGRTPRVRRALMLLPRPVRRKKEKKKGKRTGRVVPRSSSPKAQKGEAVSARTRQGKEKEKKGREEKGRRGRTRHL